MIVTIEALRKAIKGIGQKTLIEITERGITVFKGQSIPSNRRTISRAAVISLLDQGFSVDEIAAKLDVATDSVRYIRNELERARSLIDDCRGR